MQPPQNPYENTLQTQQSKRNYTKFTSKEHTFVQELQGIFFQNSFTLRKQHFFFQVISKEELYQIHNFFYVQKSKREFPNNLIPEESDAFVLQLRLTKETDPIHRKYEGLYAGLIA